MKSCSWRGRVPLLLLLAVLSIGADGKKNAKKHKKRASHAPMPQVGAAAAGAAAVANDAAPAEVHQVQQCDAAKLEKWASQYNGENHRVVDKHNHLAAEYNRLLKSHTDLIKRFNNLVEELEDPALANFLAAKAIKASHHPGIEGAVNKTLIHVLPVTSAVLQEVQANGGEWMNQTQSKVQAFLAAHGGEAVEAWLPGMSGFIVYGSVLIPFTCACWCVLEFVCKLHKLILFGHIYMALSTTAMAGLACYSGEDPLSTFAEQDPGLFQFAQCTFALVFVLYGIFSCVAACAGADEKDCSLRTLHCLAVICFGVGYYLLVWTPAMIDELPKVDEFVESLMRPASTAPAGQEAEVETTPIIAMAPYAVIALVFTFLAFFERSPCAGGGDNEEEEEKDK